MKLNMTKITIPMALFLFMAWSIPVFAAENEEAPGRVMAKQATRERKRWITVDHSKLESLNRVFTSGEQITEACVSCHTDAAEQFKQTIHWTWLDPKTNGDKKFGKGGDSLNNFCISTNMKKDKKCSSCHPSWNMKHETVNCLRCHGQISMNFTEAFDDYNAFVNSDDEEEKDIAGEIQGDIRKAVQAVGLPTRKNCGGCHFKGGGGDGVKHGDLDTSMTNPNRMLDVHMGTDGKNFQCVRCHTTVSHHVAGRIYSTPAAKDRKSLVEDDLTPKIMCESCHTATPHKEGSKMNDHTDKVACQSCHIPEFARVLPTKMFWDWSKAGKKKDGKPYKVEGELGKEIYMSIKGEMKWAKNVKPEYMWFNGSLRTLTVKDVVDPADVVKVAAPVGDMNDPNARIFPFKVHRGRQPYDKVNKTLLPPLLSGKNGYWTTFDWIDALTRGTRAMNLPFSGQFDFVDTSYVFPTTHMVIPKEKALACTECHIRENGRLADLAGFYMPGRDRFGMLDTFGWVLVIGSLIGTALHGLGRIFTRRNGKE